MSLDNGRKAEYLERTQADTGRKQVNSTQKVEGAGHQRIWVLMFFLTQRKMVNKDLDLSTCSSVYEKSTLSEMGNCLRTTQIQQRK